ncbi:hypothetical protein JCM9140_3175 [Halalkalibacter wakoensis JCM 9140]|uniref:Uncharacterized protein n=1 Tax=Halalkalibacter wakoensis JCM 9140 TaxID=1236970 RepID=W4Q5T6_9BACI|nr:hypothetical protein JCM9140_3175 [Halalkalibacter wakoensis JCM 9140]
MNLLEKLYSLIILLAVIIGLGVGQVERVSTYAEILIVPLIIAMLYMLRFYKFLLKK